MSEGRKDLIARLEKEQAECSQRYNEARRVADKEAAQYNEEMVSALETALFALKEKERTEL